MKITVSPDYRCRWSPSRWNRSSHSQATAGPHPDFGHRCANDAEPSTSSFRSLPSGPRDRAYSAAEGWSTAGWECPQWTGTAPPAFWAGPSRWGRSIASVSCRSSAFYRAAPCASGSTWPPAPPELLSLDCRLRWKKKCREVSVSRTVCHYSLWPSHAGNCSRHGYSPGVLDTNKVMFSCCVASWWISSCQFHWAFIFASLCVLLFVVNCQWYFHHVFNL